MVENYTKRPLRTKSDLAKYYCRFKAIALGLLNQGKLSANKINKRFWFGSHNSAHLNTSWRS